jgi:hypothetical protein
MNNTIVYVSAKTPDSTGGDITVDRGQLFVWTRLYFGLYLNFFRLITINSSLYDRIFMEKIACFKLQKDN